MNENTAMAGLRTRRFAASLLCGVFLVSTSLPTLAAPKKSPAAPDAKTRVVGGPLAPCSETAEAAPVAVTLGKYRLVNLPAPVVRLIRGDAGPGHTGVPAELVKDGARASAPPAPVDAKTGVGDADVMLLSPTQLYLLGKHVGGMNLITQDRNNKCTLMDIVVTMDAGALQTKFTQVMPEEKNIRVAAADDSLVLSGEVADAVKVARAMTLAAAYAPEKRLVNLLRATGASQVMLEVKVAEISKTLLDKLGGLVQTTSGGSAWQYSLASNFLTDGSGLLQALKTGKGLWQINGEKDDGVVRVLAEPNLMAISGQQASFLSGGKIFIPVAQSNNGGIGGTTITLEEKEFGVGLKFIPTVLEGDRISLKVTTEVSELSQTGSPFTTVGGVTAVLPSMTTRRADTSVQLKDGQSFAIAGLIKNNVTESVKRFPGLGEIPLLGALFRSSEFQRDMTELLFIITPRLVKPLPANYALPTDSFKEPSRGEFLFGGKLEGSPEPKPAAPAPAAPVSDAGRSAPARTGVPARATAAPAAMPRQDAAEDKLPAAEPLPVIHETPTPIEPAKSTAVRKGLRRTDALASRSE